MTKITRQGRGALRVATRLGEVETLLFKIIWWGWSSEKVALWERGMQESSESKYPWGRSVLRWHSSALWKVNLLLTSIPRGHHSRHIPHASNAGSEILCPLISDKAGAGQPRWSELSRKARVFEFLCPPYILVLLCRLQWICASLANCCFPGHCNSGSLHDLLVSPLDPFHSIGFFSSHMPTL